MKTAPIHWRRVAIIARREYRATVRRREFLAITLGLPLLYLLMFLLIFGASASAIDSAQRKQSSASPASIGFYDGSHILDQRALESSLDGYHGRGFPSRDAGLNAVRNGKVRALVVVHPDFSQTGKVTVYVPPTPFSIGPPTGSNQLRGVYTRLLRRAALIDRVDPLSVELALLPVDVTTQAWDPKTGHFSSPDPSRELARFAVPYAFSLLLVVSVLLSSSYLMHGIVEEKENRIIEVLLAATSHEELLLGKLIGLGSVGLTQLGLWLASGLVVAAAVHPATLAASSSPAVIGCAVLMFGLGFALYAALMAGVGSLGTSWRESQHIASVGSSILVIPLLFLPVILEDPDGTTARVLSLFPLTAPNAMMLRIAAGGGSIGEVIVTTVFLVLSIWAAVRLSARLFRMSLLMTGQRPSPREVWEFLVARSPR